MSCINFSNQGLPGETETEAKAVVFITLLKKYPGPFE